MDDFVHSPADNGGQLFKVLGPNKIWLSADAKEWAREWNMSDQAMAKFLLIRSRQGDGYGPMQEEPFLPTVQLGEID